MNRCNHSSGAMPRRLTSPPLDSRCTGTKNAYDDDNPKDDVRAAMLA
jgi:hypothetical protein